jgi:hypothetical protein
MGLVCGGKTIRSNDNIYMLRIASIVNESLLGDLLELPGSL